MSLSTQFDCWRQIKGPLNSWGLSWFLASEFCKRFYASHGLVPWVIAHEGLGYYGISINQVPCAVNQRATGPLGRFTMFGDVENWMRGGPGDHGLQLIEDCLKGVPTVELVRFAIEHLAVDVFPTKSHSSCRHKRWGDSYVLCFEIAAYLALRFEVSEMAIWNHPEHIASKIESLDPKSSMKYHSGAFLFNRGEKELLVCGDGRILDGSGTSVWECYMKGMSIPILADLITQRLHA